MKLKKINILEINGSPRGLKGNTAKIVDEILNVSKQEAEIFGYSLNLQRIELHKLNIKNCIGCENCFREGSCSLSKTDDLKKVEEELLKSNVIIFSSPVYFIHISGLMKNFLDRIALWTHTFKLRNKYGLAVASSGGTGLEDTLDYLEIALRALGMWSIGKVGNVFYHPIKTKKDAKKYGKKLIQMVHNDSGRPDKTDYEIFQAMKFKASMKKVLPYDWKYWNERNWFNLKHFSEEQ
ncbi:MAG: flavodoxin family protein [Promethearchaeota archaeon]